MTRHPFARAAMIVLVVQLLLTAQERKRVREEDLDSSFRSWLKLVAYLILPQEKDVFMELTSDVERKIFIEAFWKQRDPTPGTPENEYREEINRRFEYINKEFRKGSPREGWMTDMGRIYMMLGAPLGRESIVKATIHPCEIWTYHGDAAKGQPVSFGFIFFRRGGSGEFKLYNPVADGPAALLIDSGDFNKDDSAAVYQKIREEAPILAPYVLSYIPNELTYGYEPSLRSDSVLMEILEAPKKSVSPSYATHFLNYKGLVSTEYLTNFVESEGDIAILQDPLQQVLFLHYAVVPKTVSVDYFAQKDQYYCNYTVDVSLRRDEEILYQYSKDFSYYFPPADTDMVTANGISIQDMFPIIAGQFKLTVLLRNSVGKEFSLYERDINVEPASRAVIYGPVFGYKLENAGSSTLMAFKLVDQRLLTDPRNTFAPDEEISFLFGIGSLTDDLLKNGHVRISVRGLKPEGGSVKDFKIRLAGFVFQHSMSLSYSFPAADLAPDYYEIKLSLVNREERVVAEKTANFIVSSSRELGRPVILSKAFPRANIHLFYFVLSGQYEKTGDLISAEACLQKGYEAVPDNPDAISYYSRFLLRSKKYDKALEFIEKIREVRELRFDFCMIKGILLKERGRYREALELLLEGNRIYNSDTQLLNALSYCYWKTGQKEKALEAVQASLRLNPGQEEAKKLLSDIEK